MRKYLSFLFTVCFFLITVSVKSQKDKQYAIVIHGGAGNIIKSKISEERQKAYRDKLQEALKLGEQMLKQGKHGTEVVVKVIQVLEESPLFNAGKGAVFTYEGKNELDASIMNGKTMNAGAVAGITNVKSPIELAFNVMEHSKHVMLSGKGASEFAKERGLEIVKPKYFAVRKKNKKQKTDKLKNSKHGTVGCAVLDIYGNLAAGTSTGGMSNKRYGRIGDSPVIGAGTYANNATCAVSCTGHGEYFIRYVVAYTVSALMEMKNMSLKDASNYIINDKLVKAGGSGGLIAVDKNGNINMPFNTKGMFRAFAKSNGESGVFMFKNE